MIQFGFSICCSETNDKKKKEDPSDDLHWFQSSDLYWFDSFGIQKVRRPSRQFSLLQACNKFEGLIFCRLYYKVITVLVDPIIDPIMATSSLKHDLMKW